MSAAAIPARASGRAPVLGWIRDRGMGASILVAAVSSAFGAILLSTTGFLSALLRADPTLGDSRTLSFVLNVLAFLFVGIAVYVGAIVTANTSRRSSRGARGASRSSGSSAPPPRSQRVEVSRQGLVIGCLGALAGLVFGLVLAWAGIPVLTAVLQLPDVAYAVAQPVLLFRRS